MIETTEIFDFTDFFEQVQDHPQYRIAQSQIERDGHKGLSFEDIPCRIYNPALAAFLMQPHITGNRLLIVDEFTLIDGKTHQKQTRSYNGETVLQQPQDGITPQEQIQELKRKGISIAIWPLMEAYCTGYQAGRAEMEKRYPNPPMVAKDLKIIFEKELRRAPNQCNQVTTVEGMARIGHHAGQYSMILDWAEQYPESLKGITTRPENKPEKVLPSLRDIFTNKDYFNTVLHRIKSEGICSMNSDTGQYHWKKSLNQLGGFAYKLKNQHRINYSGSNQELGLVFCQFFNIELSNEKAFQPKQSKEQAHHFNWITNFSE